MNDIVLVSPSFKRGKKKTRIAEWVPSIIMAVHEFEAKEYRASGHNVVVIPDSLRGNIARVRNWILNHYKKEFGVVMIDDDVSRIYRWQDCKQIDLIESDLLEFVESGFNLCEEYGLKLWGMNVIPDKSAYREYTPFSFLSPVLGTFSAVRCNSNLRYDERFSLKEDYDFFLQQVNAYRGALRFNMFQYVVDHKKLVGGCSTYRNMAKEIEQFQLLQKKWGKECVSTHSTDGRHKNEKRNSREHKFDTNPLIRVPIHGV